jgi:hypothetical protein
MVSEVINPVVCAPASPVLGGARETGFSPSALAFSLSRFPRCLLAGSGRHGTWDRGGERGGISAAAGVARAAFARHAWAIAHVAGERCSTTGLNVAAALLVIGGLSVHGLRRHHRLLASAARGRGGVRGRGRHDVLRHHLLRDRWAHWRAGRCQGCGIHRRGRATDGRRRAWRRPIATIKRTTRAKPRRREARSAPAKYGRESRYGQQGH